MTIDWNDIILGNPCPQTAWRNIFSTLLDRFSCFSNLVDLNYWTVEPDRILSEAAWELWEAYPSTAEKTSNMIKNWCANISQTHGQAVLIVDALSLREMIIILKGAKDRSIEPIQIKTTASECPSTTGPFAKSLGLSSRGVLANDGKPKNWALFGDNSFYTDVISLPFEDCSVPHYANIFFWYTKLDDLIHTQNISLEHVAGYASATFQSQGFWDFVNRLRQGRKLVITSDHGYGVSKLFSSEVKDKDTIDVLRQAFGASRYKSSSQSWPKRFMPPIVMSYNGYHIIMGQWKWAVHGGFPHICHGGMTLLEVASPWLEFPAL